MARILLSALAARGGGGVTYLRNIVRTFPEGQDELSVLSVEPIAGFPERPNVRWIPAPAWTALPIPRFLIGFFYFRFGWRRRHDFDAVYYASGSFDVALPRSAARIVAFRNMLPFDQASRRGYRLGWTRLRHLLLRFIQGHAMSRADCVIFISEYGRQVIDGAIEDRQGGSVVIPNGVARVDASLSPATRARLPERFVLYLSAIDPYKAQVELVEAWALLRRTRPLTEKLVLAGPEYAPYARRVRDAVRRHGLEEEVILLGGVGHDEVFALAERSELNLFLSACENCPNILLELMRAGRPMLVSSRQPMPELGGPGLEYVDPHDVPAVAAALGRLMADADLRRRVGDAGEQRSRMFDWDRAGALTWSTIKSVAAQRPIPGRRGALLAPGVLPSTREGRQSV